MEEVGTVVAVKGDGVTVEIARSAMCSKCKMCNLGPGTARIDADNSIGAEVGDMVAVEMETRNVMAAAFVAYMVPLAFMIAGFLIGPSFSRWLGLARVSQAITAITGIVFLVLSYAFVYYYDKKANPSKFRARVTKLIERSRYRI
ncbi:MAG TPA: SoxR reducing system RseC family protein [Firmicutes bacterium]|nr:SoxR reducing system RseC family protein [Bacillota bacterium]